MLCEIRQIRHFPSFYLAVSGYYGASSTVLTGLSVIYDAGGNNKKTKKNPEQLTAYNLFVIYIHTFTYSTRICSVREREKRKCHLCRPSVYIPVYACATCPNKRVPPPHWRLCSSIDLSPDVNRTGIRKKKKSRFDPGTLTFTYMCTLSVYTNRQRRAQKMRILGGVQIVHRTCVVTSIFRVSFSRAIRDDHSTVYSCIRHFF